MVKAEERARKTAIFIDLANFIISLEKGKYKINKALYKLFELSGSYGKVVETRAFSDFGRVESYIQQILLSKGIEFIHCASSLNGNGESKFDDTELIEAIHDCLRRDIADFFIIVSSDSMIFPITRTLRRFNKDVRIFGFSECSSSFLKRSPGFIALNRFFEKEDNHRKPEAHIYDSDFKDASNDD